MSDPGTAPNRRLSTAPAAGLSDSSHQPPPAWRAARFTSSISGRSGCRAITTWPGRIRRGPPDNQPAPEFRARAIFIKEQRSELVKHHLWVLWTDYFKPPHFEKYPQLNQLFNEATKLAGAAGTKGSVDVAKADELLAKIEEINKIFWETKQA